MYCPSCTRCARGSYDVNVAEAGGAERILHFGSKTTKSVKVHLSFGGGANEYKLVLAPTKDDGLYVASEIVFFWDTSRYPEPYSIGLEPEVGGREAGISSTRTGRIAEWVRNHLDRLRLYHVSDTSASSPMRKTATINNNRFLRPDGSKFGSICFSTEAET